MALILVAEDEAPTVEHVRSALSSQGWLVKTVSSREQAILAASEYAPQLVLINEQLNGAEDLVRTFCRSSGGPGVVLMSQRDDELESPSQAATGADAVLLKPFHTEDLIESVRQRLNSTARRKPVTRDSEPHRIFSSQEIFGDLIADLMEDSVAPIEASVEPIQASVDPIGPTADPVDDSVTPIEASIAPMEDTIADLPPQAESPVSVAPTPVTSQPEMDEPAEVVARPSVPAAIPRKPPEKTLDERLDQTLAGVLAATLEASPEASPRKRSETIVDDLLRRTLSEVERPVTSAPAPEQGGSERSALDALPPELTATGAPRITRPRPPVKKAGKSSARRPKEPPAAEKPSAAEDGPREFGEYTLEERIGRGGMAEVWKARRRGVEGFEKTVAIKKILPEPADNSAFVEMLIDEAKVAAQLNHPHITHIYDLGCIEGDYFIAMEHVEGMNLRKILDHVRRDGLLIPADLALFIASRVAGALDYAHRKRDENNKTLGLVHRDVSPQNVLIGFEGDIKLCDFGIAKAVSKVSTTQIGALKGKLQYMSPEQAWGREDIDARSDVFALGSLLFEMLSGERLFSGSSEIAVLEAVRNCRTAERLGETRGIPTQVRSLLLKALAKDPADRFKTAGDVQKNLEEILRRLKPAPGQEQLAEFMAAVQSGGPVGEEHRPADESDDERLRSLLETAGGVEPVEQAEAPLVPMVTAEEVSVSLEAEAEAELEKEETGSRRRLVLIAAIAAVLAVILIAVGVWTLSQRADSDQRPAEQAGSVVTPVAPETELLEAGAPAARDTSFAVPAADRSSGALPVQEGGGAAPETGGGSPPPTPSAGGAEQPSGVEPPEGGDSDLARRFEEELQRVEELLSESPYGDSVGDQGTGSDGPRGR